MSLYYLMKHAYICVCVCVCVCVCIYIYIYKLITTIQVEGMIYWGINTIAFRFYWTIIWTMRGDINNFKLMMDV